MIPVVSHHENFVFPHLVRPEIQTFRCFGKPGLAVCLTVNISFSLFDFNCITGDANDPFHKQRAVLIQNVRILRGRLKDNDISSVYSMEQERRPHHERDRFLGNRIFHTGTRDNSHTEKNPEQKESHHDGNDGGKEKG